MEEHPCPNWISLPAEIVQNILQLAALKQSKAESCNCALVCKAWLQPARSAIYSNITIRDMLHLRKFTNTVKIEGHLGELVKVFELRMYLLEMSWEAEDAIKVEIAKYAATLLSSLINLEELHGVGLISYGLVVNALLNSQLKRLKRLAPPEDDADKNEIISYVKCTLLLKDRIEKIYISSDHSDESNVKDTVLDRSPFNHLLKELAQFEKLTDIRIKRDTRNEIKELEYIVETCKTLKGISSVFLPPKNERNLPFNDDVSINSISNFTRSSNIKTLGGLVYISKDYKTLAYVIHKFIQLDRLSIEMLENSLDSIEQHLLTQFLHFLSNINSYWVRRLLIDPSTYARTFRDYWNQTAKPGSKYVKISYELWFQEGRVETTMSKSNRPGSTYTLITYPLRNFNNINWMHMDFLQENGLFIRELLITLKTANVEIPDNWELPINFMTHIFTYCPNLQYLHFNKCALKQSFRTEIDSSNKLVLKELYITDCIL